VLTLITVAAADEKTVAQAPVLASKLSWGRRLR
jgi:hypothetical protein